MIAPMITRPLQPGLLLYALGIALIFALAPVNSSAEPRATDSVQLRLEAGRHSRGLVLKLGWPASSRVLAKKNSRSLLLEFDRPLESRRLSRQIQQLKSWVKEGRYGYDSLLLTWQPGFEAKVQRTRNQVQVVLLATATRGEQTPKNPKPSAKMPSNYRIQILQGETWLAAGEGRKAREVLFPLLMEYGENGDLLSALARAEEMMGNWPGAVAYYQRLAQNEKTALLARAEIKRLHRQFGSHLTVETGQKSTEDADDQTITSFSGRYHSGGRWSTEASLEQRDVDFSGAQNVVGETHSQRAQRKRLSLTANHTSERGHNTEVGIIASESGPGLHLRQSLKHGDGESAAELNVNEAYWDYVEGIFNDASRDQLKLSHARTLTPRLRGQIAVEANQYHLEDHSNLARSSGAEVNLNYLVKDKNPVTEMAYVFDHENISDLDNFTDTAGQAYSPLPLTDRNAHSLALHVSDEVGSNGFYRTSIGYVNDADNSSGAFASGQLGLITDDGLELGLRASRSVSNTSSDDASVVEFGGYMTWYPQP